MAKFKYAAVTPEGRQVNGTIDGVSVNTVTSVLLDRGLNVSRVKKRSSVLQLEITPEKVKLPEVMNFSRQMAAFVRAGVPILDALQVVREEATDKKLKVVLDELADSLRSGQTISAAMAQHDKAFPRFYTSVLASAEVTGRLDVVLDHLARYLERDYEARRKIRSALTYPAMIMVMSGITIGVISGFVMPRFKSFFLDLHAKLPLPTRMLIATTNFIQNWWLFMLGGTVAFVLALLLALQTETGRALRDRALIKTPVLGPVVRYTIVERFCRVLSSMVEAGVPLPDAMHLAAEGANNIVYKTALEAARLEMIEGEGISRPISRSGLFPSAVVQMIRVGEDTGTLDDQLEVMASYYGVELDYKLKRLTTLFEPAAVILMGLNVGFVAIALVSAMYGVFNQVKV